MPDTKTRSLPRRARSIPILRPEHKCDRGALNSPPSLSPPEQERESVPTRRGQGTKAGGGRSPVAHLAEPGLAPVSLLRTAGRGQRPQGTRPREEHVCRRHRVLRTGAGAPCVRSDCGLPAVARSPGTPVPRPAGQTDAHYARPDAGSPAIPPEPRTHLCRWRG